MVNNAFQRAKGYLGNSPGNTERRDKGVLQSLGNSTDTSLDLTGDFFDNVLVMTRRKEA